MDCSEARTYLLDRRRGRLDEALRAQVDEHLAGCADCRQEDAADRELSAALEKRLPKRAAPASLKRSLEERMVPARPRPWGRLARSVAAVSSGAAAAVLAMLFWGGRPAGDAMVGEAVNDYLRILYSEHPVEVDSGGVHQVKPWFEGRVDFAPVTAFGGDDDFPLQGGSVSYFLDRKAAAYVFRRRLHVITLLMFRADGLPWATLGLRPIGHARGTVTTSRGYHVALWRDGDIGYAVVSDVNEADLLTLAARVAGP